MINIEWIDKNGHRNCDNFLSNASVGKFIQELIEQECCSISMVQVHPYIRQFSIDVIDCDDNFNEKMIQDAIEKAGIPVLGCAWKATWTEEGYRMGTPISSD